MLEIRPKIVLQKNPISKHIVFKPVNSNLQNE